MTSSLPTMLHQRPCRHGSPTWLAGATLRPPHQAVLPTSKHPQHVLGAPPGWMAPKADLTFGGQSTYVLKVEGRRDAFIFMADIWRPKHPSDARYIWLPIDFKNGLPVVEWRDEWTLEYFKVDK